MAKPWSSGVDQERWTRVALVQSIEAVTSGAAGGLSTSFTANRRRPLTCRAIVAMAVKLLGPLAAQVPMQPSAEPRAPRPSRAIEAAVEASRVRVPLLQ